MIYFVALIFLLCILLFLLERRSFGKDSFSPGKVVIYYYLVSFFPVVWYALNKEAFNDHVLSRLSMGHISKEHILYAIALGFLGFLSSYIGVFFAKASGSSFFIFFFNRFFGSLTIDVLIAQKKRRVAFTLGFLSIISIVLFLYQLSLIGGIFGLWSNLSLRTTVLSGTSHIQIFYRIFIVSIVLIFFYAYGYRKKLLFSFVFFAAMLMLGA